jgi:hypothetical protein
MTTFNFKYLATLHHNIIAGVRARVLFEKFEMTDKDASQDELDQLSRLPSVGTACIARTHGNNKSGSAFCQIQEQALVGGYLRTPDGLKALIVFHDRPKSEEGYYDFAFLLVAQVKRNKIKTPA